MTKQKRVFLTDLAAYNEGILSGRWVDLPVDPEELQEITREVLERGFRDAQAEDLCCCEHHEEYFITDYEGFNHLDEYENLSALNEFLLACEDVEPEVLDLLLDNFSGNRDEVLEIIEEGRYRVYYDVDNGEDVVYQSLEEQGVLDSLPDWLSESYIDLAQIWIDWEIEGTYIFNHDAKICVEVFN